jgi:hypothetical protein
VSFDIRQQGVAQQKERQRGNEATRHKANTEYAISHKEIQNAAARFTPWRAKPET